MRLSLDAVVAVVASYLDEGQQESVRQALVRAGAPDTSFGGVLKATLRKVAGKVADHSGEALVEAAGDYMKPMLLAGPARQLGALVRPVVSGCLTAKVVHPALRAGRNQRHQPRKPPCCHRNPQACS